MTRLLALVAMLAVLAFVVAPSTAMADEPQETVYDFEGEDLEGAILRPMDERITGDQGDRRSSLINIREDFIPEMLESVETL
jgi:hypothetical protein